MRRLRKDYEKYPVNFPCVNIVNAPLHLISFDPKSIMVSTNSLKEVNRLRQTYRPDLSLYNIPNDSNKIHKFTGKTDIDDSHLPNFPVMH